MLCLSHADVEKFLLLLLFLTFAKDGKALSLRCHSCVTNSGDCDDPDRLRGSPGFLCQPDTKYCLIYSDALRYARTCMDGHAKGLADLLLGYYDHTFPPRALAICGLFSDRKGCICAGDNCNAWAVSLIEPLFQGNNKFGADSVSLEMVQDKTSSPRCMKTFLGTSDYGQRELTRLSFRPNCTALIVKLPEIQTGCLGRRGRLQFRSKPIINKEGKVEYYLPPKAPAGGGGSSGGGGGSSSGGGGSSGGGATGGGGSGGNSAGGGSSTGSGGNSGGDGSGGGSGSSGGGDGSGGGSSSGGGGSGGGTAGGGSEATSGGKSPGGLAPDGTSAGGHNANKTATAAGGSTNGTSKGDASTEGGPNLILIIAIVGGILLVAAGVGGYVYHDISKKKKKKEQDDEDEDDETED